MNYIHTISIYALLGHDRFATMMNGVFEQEVGENSIEDFLLMLRRKSQKNNNRDNEHQRNNRDDRHRLQKLIDERWTCKV
jgi:hypothetical protein